MKHVLLISRALIPSVSLCGHSQLSLLAEQGKIEYQWARSREVKSARLAWAEVVIFVRADRETDVLAAEAARRAGKYLVYVLDDDLLHVPECISSAEFYHRSETRESIRRVMSLCDCLLSPSDRLLEKYGGDFPRCGRIEEPAQKVQPSEKKQHRAVRIGFAGSIDRAGDIDALLTGALRRILKENPGTVTAEFFGARPALVDEFVLRHIPYCDNYEDYLRTMDSLDWDIGLAPLPETEFHACKHYNKYIEYAAHGIAGVYSDGSVYPRAVRHGENGLLTANTEEGWYETILRLVRDGALRRTIAAEAKREAESLYSLETVAEQWERHLEDFNARAGEPEKLRRFDRDRRRALLRRRWQRMKHYGWKTPFVLLKKLWDKLAGHRRG